MGKALKQLARVNHYTALSTINTEIHQKKKNATISRVLRNIAIGNYKLCDL